MSVARRLLDNGADVNLASPETRYTPLIAAVEGGSLDLIRSVPPFAQCTFDWAVGG